MVVAIARHSKLPQKLGRRSVLGGRNFPLQMHCHPNTSVYQTPQRAGFCTHAKFVHRYTFMVPLTSSAHTTP